MCCRKTPNPYMFHGGSGPGAEWYLSVDIKVFQLKAGDKMFGLTAAQGHQPAGRRDDLDSKDNRQPQWRPSRARTGVRRAAVGRGHRGAQPASNRRFRKQHLQLRPGPGAVPGHANSAERKRILSCVRCAAGRHDLRPGDHLQLFTSGSTVVPVLGLQGDEIVTIPFFAAPRGDASKALSGQSDPKNTHTINPDPLGAEVDTFYGCWLDINQPTDRDSPTGWSGTRLPTTPTDRTAASITLFRSCSSCGASTSASCAKSLSLPIQSRSATTRRTPTSLPSATSHLCRRPTQG